MIGRRRDIGCVVLYLDFFQGKTAGHSLRPVEVGEESPGTAGQDTPSARGTREGWKVPQRKDRSAQDISCAG